MSEAAREGAWTGGCQCGAVRFRAERLHDNAHICHCRMCQKAVGNFFAALVGAPRDAVTWTRGRPASFRSSGPVTRGFCARCGTPLTYERDGSANVTLTIGAFDHPERLKPVTQDGIESRVPWFHDLVDVPDEGPTESGDFIPLAAEIRRTSQQHPDHDTDRWPPEPGE